MTPDFLFNIRHGADLEYNIETYPNVFAVFFLDRGTGHTWYFEISEFRDDMYMLCRFIQLCSMNSNRWVGYNSLNFDYPVMHFIYQNQKACITVADIYKKAMSIIDAPFNAKFAHVIWANDQIIPQIDLFKIHHFDLITKSTSLKILEFNMRSDRVESQPFPVSTILNEEQRDKLAWFNEIQVRETGKFSVYSADAIKMREELSEKFGMDLMNCSDVMIGEKILIYTIEQRGIKTTVNVDGKNKKLQTNRTEIVFKDIIFPCVKMEHHAFKLIYDKLYNTVMRGAEIDEAGKDDQGLTTKGLFKDLIANIDGLEYKFGTGGLHGSVDSRIVRSNNTHQLVDIDVASYYPNLAIKNELFPEHLTVEFCVAYEQIYQTRKSYAKGTPENEAYKLALNGSYGKSNSKYSALFDPKYTMAITINGQLLLAMLIEQMIKIPGLKMVQANTDGITYLCPRQHLEQTLKIINWWQEFTKLELEEVHYDSMFILNINSYIAVKEDGKIKRIGAYAYETADDNPGTRELPWHKDWSFRIVPIAAEAVLVKGANLREFITEHSDVYNFFGRTKVPRNSQLIHGSVKVPNIVRYYVSTDGAPLEKIMPANGPEGAYKRANNLTDMFYGEVLAEIGPEVWDERVHTKNRSVYAERRIGINTGYNVTIASDLTAEVWVEEHACFNNIDYEFYIKETEKLINLAEMV